MYAKLPVNIVKPFSVENDKVIWFNIDALPVTDTADMTFAGELFFYKKGQYYSITAEGVAEVKCFDSLCVKFTINNLNYQEYAKPPKKNPLKEKLLPMLKVIPSVSNYGNRIRLALSLK